MQGNKETFCEQLQQAQIPFEQEEPMSRHTSFRIGGAAEWFLRPQSAAQLEQTVRLLDGAQIPYVIVGNGSNLLVSDRGIRGAVLQPQLCGLTFDGNELHCGCGVLLSHAAKEAAKRGLDGLVFASGIPGSIGGAVRMNAGAYGGEMKDIVVKTTCFDPDRMEFFTVSGEEHRFGYRHSVFCDRSRWIVCDTTLRLTPGDPAEIARNMEELARKRREKQPVNLPSAGSTFKRPQGDYAAALIDRAGLRGFRIGGAQVSEKHTGFVVNTGGATAEDVKALMRHIREEVQRQFGILLEPEVCLMGE